MLNLTATILCPLKFLAQSFGNSWSKKNILKENISIFLYVSYCRCRNLKLKLCTSCYEQKAIIECLFNFCEIPCAYLMPFCFCTVCNGLICQKSTIPPFDWVFRWICNIVSCCMPPLSFTNRTGLGASQRTHYYSGVRFLVNRMPFFEFWSGGCYQLETYYTNLQFYTILTMKGHTNQFPKFLRAVQ